MSAAEFFHNVFHSWWKKENNVLKYRFKALIYQLLTSRLRLKPAETNIQVSDQSRGVKAIKQALSKACFEIRACV